jgi:hypothetical protein
MKGSSIFENMKKKVLLWGAEIHAKDEQNIADDAKHAMSRAGPPPASHPYSVEA